MKNNSHIILSAKCAPQKHILSDIHKAGIKAVELYLNKEMLEKDLQDIVHTCKNFPLRYSVHAPNNGYNPTKLAKLVKEIFAEVVVFHNVYWEDEWENIIRIFKKIKTKLCVENVYSVHEPLKFIRRYNIGSCLDMEHMQMECAGVYEEVFVPIIKQASHIHLTGYTFGSDLWHTHIHHSPKHNLYILNLIKKSGYSGFIVSEAKTSLQTYEEFKKLNDFWKKWQSKFDF